MFRAEEWVLLMETENQLNVLSFSWNVLLSLQLVSPSYHPGLHPNVTSSGKPSHLAHHYSQETTFISFLKFSQFVLSLLMSPFICLVCLSH